MVCAVDCGVAVNPDVIRAQMEGGIGFCLGAILHGAVHLEGGRVVETNVDDDEVLRLDEMPMVEVHIVPSTERPTGVGEPGVPPIGPAVANACFAATGKRCTSCRWRRAWRCDRRGGTPLLAAEAASLAGQLAAETGGCSQIHGPRRVGQHRRRQDEGRDEQGQGMGEVHGSTLRDFGLTELLGG
jgi:hypothetical protein